MADIIKWAGNKGYTLELNREEVMALKQKLEKALEYSLGHNTDTTVINLENKW